ncbi:hypothetical protein ScPMuIL_015685 [Solemya velum]
MAAKVGDSPISLDFLGSGREMDSKKKQELDALMNKLRSRSSQLKSWADSVKAVRMAINDKRCQSEALERSQLQSCLDTLQRAMKVVNQQSLTERLESISRQLGLTFTLQTEPEEHILISSDMFVVDVLLEGSGVKDVKVEHQADPSNCEELVEVLGNGDFDEFTKHLEGLMNVYTISGDRKQKCKVFHALHSLQTDLNVLAQLQSSISGVANYIHKSPLGILLPRKGGLPMKLIYFVSPYNLLDKAIKTPHPMTVEAITEHELGQSVTLCVEQSHPNRLQIIPLMTVKTQDGKSLPNFQGLNTMNSAALPASFVLTLPHPVPIATSLVQEIQAVTGLDVVTEGESKPLLNLLLEKQDTDSRELFVTLPDQQHVYFINDSGGCLEQPGVMVSKIPFTHPTNVARVLNHLRQQLLFNTVISSCIRQHADRDLSKSLVFELTSSSVYHITLMFENPLHVSMITADMDLSDITNVKFKFCSGAESLHISDDATSKVFQRCLSIPVTLRSVIQKLCEELAKEPVPMEVPSPPPLPQILQKLENTINSTNQGPMQVEPNYGNYPPPMYPNNPPPYGGFYPPPPPPPPPPAAPQPVCNYGNAPPYLDYGHAHPGMDNLSGDKISSNPLLATLLDQESQSPENSPITESPMLSKLLDDNISASANVATLSKQRRPGKRRSKSEMSVGRSPKHRLSESDKSLSAIELDSSNSSFDSDLQLPPPGGGKTGSSSVMIDLTDPDYACESHVKKLENSLHSFIQKETRNVVHQAHGASGDFSDIPLDYIEGRPIKTEIDNASPPNSSHHPKNGNISTSLEDLLDGSREVRDHSDPEHLLGKGKLSQQNSVSSIVSKSQSPNNCLEEPMEFDSDILDPSNNTKLFDPLSVGNIKIEIDKSYDSESSKLGQAAMIGSKSGSTSSYGNIFSVFEKLEFKQPVNDVQDLKTLGSSDKYERTANSLVELERNIKIKPGHQIKTEDVPAVKLKLVGMNKLESKLSSSSFHSMDVPQSTKAASKSTETFDFNSDDDDPFMMRCDKTMTVVSSSPTRLQISKSKNSLKLVSKESKSEKCRRKEYKHSTTQKRKKEKDGYKKERKKKKVNDSVYSSSSVQEPTMYRSTVESNGPNDFKRMPILKITKSGVTLSTESSPKTQSPIPKDKDKIDTSKRQTALDLSMNLSKLCSSKSEKSSQKESTKCSKSPSQKSSSKSHHRSLSSSASITVNKADSKLMTRTPTIKLKPIDLPTTSASVSVAAKTPPAVSSVATSPKITATTPTSATIGRIGAVSLATSSSSSPKGTASSSPGTMSKLSSTSHSLPKSSSTSSGKSSSPNVNRGSSGTTQLTSKSSTPPSSGRSSSQSSLSSGKSSSVSGRTLSSSTGKSRSSSPSVMKSSSSKISSGNVKSSGSSGKSSQNSSVSSAMTAASVLSFLNTNASKIASLPPIPKVNSSSASHGTSNKLPLSSQSGSVPKSVTTTSNSTSSKFSSSSGTMSNKVVSSSSTGSGNKSVMSLPGGSTKGNNSSNNKSSNNFTGNKMASVSNGTNSNNKSTTATTGSSSVNKSVSSSASVSKSSNSSSLNMGVQSKVQVPAVNNSSSNTASNAATVMSAPSSAANNKSRPRKGSLSAVIDKLKKASGAGFQPDGVDDIVQENYSPEEKELMNEKFLQATGDLIRAIDGELNSRTKLEHNSDSDSFCNTRLLSGGESLHSAGGPSHDSVTSNCVQQMESENSGQSRLPLTGVNLSPSHRHSPTTAVGKQNSSSSKSHSDGHDPKTGNPRHVRKNNETPAISSKKSSSRSRESSPQVGTKTTSQENAKVLDKSNKNAINSKKEPSKSESASDISAKRSKDSDFLDHATNVQHRVSPVKKSKSDSFYVTPNSKFNGETSRDCPTPNCKDSSSKDKDVFKAPSLDDKDSEDIENLVVRRKQRSSKPLLSPGSPGSSPENGLIIDCPASPRHLQNRTNSPQPNMDNISSETRDKLSNSAWRSSTTACTPSPKVKQTSILTPSPKVKQSPIASSPYKEHSNPCSVSNNSPYNIDDDLMDEALMA